MWSRELGLEVVQLAGSGDQPVVAAALGVGEGAKVRVIRIDTGETLFEQGVEWDTALGVAFLADGRLVAAGVDGGVRALWVVSREGLQRLGVA